MARRSRWSVGRIVWTAVIAGAIVFAVQGGEYTTLDLIRQHRAKGQLEDRLDSLRVVVDSLTRALKAARTDRATQERIAREEFGMVRGEKEILYRFADVPDTPR